MFTSPIFQPSEEGIQMLQLIDAIPLTLIFAIIVTAILTVEIKDLMRAVISFCLMSISIGFLYAYLGALIVAFYQIIVYAGAVGILFIFAVMLSAGGSTVEKA